MNERLNTKILGKTIKAQVAYQKSIKNFETTKAIINNKFRNSIFVFTDYINSRKRFGYNFDQLIENQNIVKSLCKNIFLLSDKSNLFILEAKIAKVYWDSFKIICRLDKSWKRIYPKATEPVNILLNIGYTILAKVCKLAIEKSGLLSQIGIYHDENSENPLIYDFMESFRITAVDNILMPIFSRKRLLDIKKDSDDFRKVIFKLNEIYGKKFLYENKRFTLKNIIEYEAVKIKQAIIENKIYKPYKFIWGHSKRFI